jgi:hypothetical protein
MNSRRTFRFLLCAILVTGFSTAGFAQATRTWVSGVGDDANPCSRTAPCKTFAGAISKTATNGEINALDPGGFGGVTITKSINIDCHDVFASILASGFTGIIVNDLGSGNDPLRTVRIRNVNINGAGLSGGVGTRTGLNGIRIDSAVQVTILDCLITDFSQNGIQDRRTTGGRLLVGNTTARNNSNSGILILPLSGSVKIDATLDNVICEGNATGIAAATGPSVMIKRSTISNNTGNGLDAEGVGVMSADNCLISNNGVNGLFTTAGGTLRVSNTDLAHNTTAANGAWTSFGNNRITGTAGTAPTAAGAATTDLGEK